MRDLIPERWLHKLKTLLLGVDSWIDFSLFRSLKGAREGYARFSGFMDRFHVSGWRRLATEFVSEGATLGTAGLRRA